MFECVLAENSPVERRSSIEGYGISIDFIQWPEGGFGRDGQWTDQIINNGLVGPAIHDSLNVSDGLLDPSELLAYMGVLLHQSRCIR